MKKLKYFICLIIVLLITSFSLMVLAANDSSKIEYYIVTVDTSVRIGDANALPKLTREEFENTIYDWIEERYSDSQVQKLKSEILNKDGIDGIMEVQNTYKISPVFVVAVATVEQQLGLSDTTIAAKGKNLFSLKGESDSGYVVNNSGRYYKKYDTYKESFIDFGKLIADSQYYFKAGNYTIQSIGKLYIGSETWIKKVVEISEEILKYYKKIDDSEEECSHDYVYKITKEATCTETGKETGTCSKCGDVVTKTIAKLEHEFSEDYEYDDEYHYNTCDICGEEVSQKHKFKNNKCTVCGYEKEVEVEKKVEDIFDDIDKQDWYHDATQYVIDEKIFNGMSDTEFGPNIKITRGMLVTVLYRLSNSKTSKKSTFDDVDENAYYSNAIYWATNKEIVNGIGNNKFAPDEEITREDLATIIARYIDKMKVKISNNKNAKTDFEDIDEISEYAKEHVETVAKKGLMQGKNDNYFDPKGKATRAEVATILMKLDK